VDTLVCTVAKSYFKLIHRYVAAATASAFGYPWGPTISTVRLMTYRLNIQYLNSPRTSVQAS
jgi:hypothetical protein